MSLSDISMAARTTIVMVTYNSKALLANMIKQLGACQLLVVDNASTDGTQALLKQSYPEVTLLENTVNQGYGRAINQALAYIDTPLMMLVNPDLQINNHNIQALEQAALEQAAPWLFIAPNTGEPPLIKDANAKPYPHIRWASGCAMLFNVQQLKALNGFDDNIFLFYEETDLCFRAHKRKINMLYASDINTPHAIGESVAMNDYVRQLKEWHYHWSKLYYLKKHGFYVKLLPLLCKALLVYPIKRRLVSPQQAKHKIYTARAMATQAFVAGKGAFNDDNTPRMT